MNKNQKTEKINLKIKMIKKIKKSKQTKINLFVQKE